MATKNLNDQANEIIKQAEQYGVDKNFLFITTFKRYSVQLKILTELEKSINADGTMTTKEYVKGRENLYTNPAIKEYNNTVNSSNRTCETLMKIIQNFKSGEDNEETEEDPLLKILNGGE